MTVEEQIEPQEKQFVPSGEIIAENVSLEDYLAQYAEHHCEWIEGIVIRMSPAEWKHNKLIY